MQTIPLKTWNESIPSSKKYLSRIFTHKLATKLNQEMYDVVFETPLTKGGESEPDIVVFDKCRGWSSIMAIEICKTKEISDLLIVARELMDKYSLLDFFLFDQEESIWYNVKKGINGYEISSNTLFMGVALDELVNGYWFRTSNN